MTTLAAEDDVTRATRPMARLRSMLAALAAGMLGYGLADAIVRAGTSDAFMVAPDPGRIAAYLLAFALLAALALAFEIGGPPIAERGGRAARGVRAAIRRRYRRGRTRADVAKVEIGLTISACLALLVAAVLFASPKSILVILTVAAIVGGVRLLSSLCRLVGFDPGWSGLIGFLCGLLAGHLLG